jgi:penicillin-binding protein 1C
MKGWRKPLLIAAAFASATLVALRLVPHAPLGGDLSRSTAIYAESGELLRLSLASDEQYRLRIPLTAMSPKLPEAVVLYEDRWFAWHPGINPIALVRSAFVTYSGSARQGGSTITMQLARRVYGIDSRTIPGKLAQIGAALWLEGRYSKREILEAYLNVAPYGGNIEGVGAASLVYFHKRAQDLTLPEALALAVIPQNPRRRLAARGAGPAQDLPVALAAARERLWQAWVAQHPEDRRFAADLALPLNPQ